MGGDKLTRAHICKIIFWQKNEERGGGLCKLYFSFFSTLLIVQNHTKLQDNVLIKNEKKLRLKTHTTLSNLEG